VEEEDDPFARSSGVNYGRGAFAAVDEIKRASYLV